MEFGFRRVGVVRTDWEGGIEDVPEVISESEERGLFVGVTDIGNDDVGVVPEGVGT